jgi:hypothetical protein
LCYKGIIGVSSGKRVPINSPLVHEVQTLHSRNGNGLCPLDLTKPGEFCANPLLCKIVCLVCGDPVMDGTDPDFELFKEFIREPTTDFETIITIQSEMKARGLEWTEQWDTPIHKRCSKKTGCKCVVAVGTTVCPTHFTRLSNPFIPAPIVVTTQPLPASPASTGQVKEKEALLLRYNLTKANWLPPPTATEVVGVEPSSPVKAVISLMPSKPEGGGASKAGSAKAKNSKTVLMAKDAEKCAFTLDRWKGYNSHPTNTKGSPLLPSNVVQGGGKKPFSLQEHMRQFDTELHGPRIRNGVKGYVRYDGVFIPTPHDVNCMQTDGSLTPG